LPAHPNIDTINYKGYSVTPEKHPILIFYEEAIQLATTHYFRGVKL